jgi:hypothetical protein
LVYASSRYTEDGVPREEYVDRINSGIANALLLGISQRYVDRVMRPLIPAPLGRRGHASGDHRVRMIGGSRSRRSGRTFDLDCVVL